MELTLKIEVVKKQITYKNVFLLFMVISWLFELNFSINNQKNYLLVPKVANVVFLGLYYFASAHKPDKIFIAFLISLLFVGALFAFDNLSSAGMYFVTLSRILLVFILLFDIKKLDKKLVKLLFLLFMGIVGTITYLLYVNSNFFYASVIATFFLVILLTVSFAQLVMFGFKKGNLAFFCAMFIFLFSDVLFGSKKLTNPETIYTALSSSCYLVAYYLITKAILKKQQKSY